MPNQKVRVRIVPHMFVTVITKHGRHVYLDEKETKEVRDELSKALRKYRKRARKK